MKDILSHLPRALPAYWLAVLAAALTATSPASAAPEPDLLPMWDAADEANAAVIDHQPWQELLTAYLRTHESGINRVDYAALKANDQDMAKLAGYLAQLQSIDPRLYARAEQKAYWINFYNALTVRVVADEHPVDSIKEIHEGWLPNTGPWDDHHATVAGTALTLNDIEHRILRPIWRDARIHYAVNCASHGCPNLSPVVYTRGNTEALLEDGARAYVNHPRGVEFLDEDFLVLSSIYDWYVVDFGDSEEGVFAHLKRYAAPALAAALEDFAGAIDYEYDWRLNEP